MSYLADYLMPRIVISLTVISLLLASSCDAPPPAPAADADTQALIAAADQAAREREAALLKVYSQPGFNPMAGVVYEPEP